MTSYRFNATSPGALVVRLYLAGQRLQWRDVESRDVFIRSGYDAWARYANARYAAAQRGDYHSHRDLAVTVLVLVVVVLLVLRSA